MKIACLTDALDHVSHRYRIRQYAPGLAARGIEIEPHAIPSEMGARIGLFRRLRRYDAVILQRRLLNLASFMILRTCSRKLVYDFDDALWVRDSNRFATASLTLWSRFRRSVRCADLVIAGNEYLQTAARRKNRNTVVLPTAVDTSRYVPAGPGGHAEAEHVGREGGLRAVWIGSSSTLLFLEALLPMLKPLADELPGFRVAVISDRFPECPEIPIERIPWSEAGEAESLRQADVGLMPLFDDAWTRGKCGLKLIQYGAAGLPSVYSSVGSAAGIAPPGVAGFAAATAEQWRESLAALAADRNLRARMGQAARKRVEEAYSVQALESRLAEILESAVAGVTVPWRG